MSNLDANNSRSTNVNTISLSLSTLNLSLMSPPPTDILCSTSTIPISISGRRIVKAKRRLVWRYFNNSDDNLLNVQCILCSSIILRETSSTSNLLHHIQTQHNSEYQNMYKAKKLQTRTTVSSSRLPLTSDRSLRLTKLAADLIIYNFLPISVVESTHLQAILQEVEPSYLIPKRKYFMNNVFQEMYDEVRQKVYEELKTAPSDLFYVPNDLWFHFLML